MHACSVCKLYINVYIIYYCVYVHIYACMCIHVCVYACACVCILAHACVCMYVHAYALINLIVLLIVQYVDHMHEGPVHCHINLQQI